MMFWGDIILHKPELLSELPRDIIALNWGYDATHPFERETKAFQNAAVPFYVCPGTSSWCSIGGRYDNMIANLKSAAQNGLKHGAIGYLNTDWGDYGHLQYWPISLPAIAAGAAFSWCYQTNGSADLSPAIDAHVFHDVESVMTSVLRDLGNVYLPLRSQVGNGTALFWALLSHQDDKKRWAEVSVEEFADCEKRIEQIVSRLTHSRMNRPAGDGALVIDELRNAAAMLTHACRRGQFLHNSAGAPKPEALVQELKTIISRHRDLWLLRNRPGGLDDSCSRLNACLTDYTPRQ